VHRSAGSRTLHAHDVAQGHGAGERLRKGRHPGGVRAADEDQQPGDIAGPQHGLWELHLLCGELE